MTRKILFLMTAMLVFGVSITSFANAVSMEDVTHVVYGDELKTMMEFDTNAVIHFTGNPDGLKGFELYDKSKAPHTSNCQSGWGDNAEEYIEYDYSGLPSLIVMTSADTLIVTNDDTANDHRMVSSAFDTGLIQYGVQVNINGDGLSGDYTWSDNITGHSGIIRVTGDNEYSVCIFETKNMALGYHEWFDRTTDTWGKFYIYQADQVSTNTSNYQEVSDAAKNFKKQIEAKMNEKLKPLQTEIAELKLQLSNADEREVLYQSQIATIKTELTTAQDNAISAQASIEELSTANASMEQYKKDADNWKAVALEQLKVMAEILGLF